MKSTVQKNMEGECSYQANKTSRLKLEKIANSRVDIDLCMSILVSNIKIK